MLAARSARRQTTALRPWYPRRRRSGRRGRLEEQAAARLQHLEEAAAKLGIEVRFASDLPCEAGACRVEGRELVFLHRRLAPSEQVLWLAEQLAVLAADRLATVYLLPEARELIEEAARRLDG